MSQIRDNRGSDNAGLTAPNLLRETFLDYGTGANRETLLLGERLISES